MKILFLTYSQIGDRSFGGAIRADDLRTSLLDVADVDTLVIDGGAHFSAEDRWSPDRIKSATISRYGLSYSAIFQRRKLALWVRQTLDSEWYDLIVAQRFDLASLIPRRQRLRMIFDPDDYQKAPSGNASILNRAKSKLRNILSSRLASQAAHVWFSNPREDVRSAPFSYSFLPNVIVPPQAGRYRPASLPDRIMMVGLFSHLPNLEGLKWFHDNILPRLRLSRPDLQLHAVGRLDQQVNDVLPNVTFRGFVDDLTWEYDLTPLVIAPIFSGGGTQIKVIDALAHGRPLVSSGFAHRGFAADLYDCQHLLTADNTDEWVAKCEWVLANPSDASIVAQSGERVVRDVYSRTRFSSIVAQTISSLSVDKVSTPRAAN